MPAMHPSMKLLLAAVAVFLAAPVAAAGGTAECVEVPVANDRCPGWTVSHDIPDAQGNRGLDEATAVATSAGRVFVAGGTEAGAPAIQILALAQTTGGTLWATRVSGAMTGLGYRVSLTVAPDGSRLLLMAASAGGDFLVTSVEPASGNIQWSATYDGPVGGTDRPRALAVAPGSDQVYVIGSSQGGRAGDLVLVALSASDGAQLWTVRYAGKYGGDAGYSVEVRPDGKRVFVAGRSRGNSSSDLVTLAYDVPGPDQEPSKKWAWVKRFIPYTNAGLSSRVGLAVSQDGSRLVMSGEGFNNFWTIAYDPANGQQLWKAELRGTPLSEGWASTLDETVVEISGGRVFVAISKAWDSGPLLASYDLATGAQRWTTRFVAGPPLETAHMVLSPGGSTLYVLASTLDAGYGASVAAFDAASGAQQWVGRMYSPTERIYGNALAISPSGDALFATGGIAPTDYDNHVQEGTLDFLTWSYQI